MTPTVPVNIPLFTGNESRYLQECITSGWVSSEGPFVSRFESAVASVCGRRHGIAVANGTVALELAVRALGLGSGDEVIIPDLTIISCALAVVRCGATPVFVDVHADEWTLDPQRIRQALTVRTKAIMAVHLYGLPAEMSAIQAIADEFGLLVIEDASELLGASCDGRPCGSFGNLSTLSFYANKHITTGEGGMILCDDPDLASRCRSLRNLCFDAERRFIHEDLGYNARMSNLQAALGLAQTEVLADTMRRKRQIGAAYRTQLAGLPLRWQPERTKRAENACWVFGIVLGSGCPSLDVVLGRLRAEGIGCRNFFWPMSVQPALKRMGYASTVDAPQAMHLAQRGFYLPSGVGTTDEHIALSCAVLRRILA